VAVASAVASAVALAPTSTLVVGVRVFDARAAAVGRQLGADMEWLRGELSRSGVESGVRGGTGPRGEAKPAEGAEAKPPLRSSETVPSNTA
jgi:hypothetical protein